VIARRIAAMVLIGFAIVAGATSCTADDGADQGDARLVVSAASSMTGALEGCAPRFGEAAGATVRLSFAGSDELAAQIRRGVRPDVYAAADDRLPKQLYDEGLLSKPVKFATNELVLAVPADSTLDAVGDLTGDGVKVAIGSESVPVGAYTRATLATLPSVQEQAVLGNVRSNEPDVKGIVGKLTQGAADAGFVYATDVKAAGDALRAIPLPAKLNPDVTYAAAVVKEAKEPSLGQAFVDGLLDGPCANALQAAGFGTAP
jgi:molybdate transport system substrate-binding protein